MPEVSVIIPIYNTAAYLRKALDSICGQTLKELEIILIDDGSTDGSRGIIEEYTTIINPQKISGAVSAYFEIETLPDALPPVIENLAQNDTITQIYRVTGQNKLHVHAIASSGEEMEMLIREVIDPLPGVVRSSCNIILSRIKDVKGLRL